MKSLEDKPHIKTVKLNDDLMIVTDYSTGESGIIDIPRQPEWMSDEKWAAYKKTHNITDPEDQ